MIPVLGKKRLFGTRTKKPTCTNAMDAEDFKSVSENSPWEPRLAYSKVPSKSTPTKPSRYALRLKSSGIFKSHLGGGWTNQFEKYARQIGSFPKARIEMKITNTLQGINISHLGKRKIIFKHALGGDMLVPQRLFETTQLVIHQICAAFRCRMRQGRGRCWRSHSRPLRRSCTWPLPRGAKWMGRGPINHPP